MHAYIHVHVSSCNKELHFVAASCGEEVISLEAKHKADSLTPGYQLTMHAQISSDLNLYCEINVPQQFVCTNITCTLWSVNLCGVQIFVDFVLYAFLSMKNC